MKRCSWLAWSVVVAVVLLIGSGAWAAQVASAQANNHSYLPLISKTESGPLIHYFRANVDVADPGDTIQLEWASSGAVSTTLMRIERGGPIAEFWDVEPTGVFTYTISEAAREFVTFSLFVVNAEGESAGAGVTVRLTCPDTWFFEPAPDGCPGGPARFTNGAEQPFEHGYMVWVEDGWTAGQAAIYVLFEGEDSDGSWALYPDTWVEGETICNAGSPPPGLLQPERGFGKLWCTEPGVRDWLGWATEAETGYETAVQRDSAPKYSTFYVRASDDNVWKLLPERSGWEKIVTSNP